MTGEELLFFNHRPEAVAVYAAFEEALKKRLGPLEPRVQKSQITYAGKRGSRGSWSPWAWGGGRAPPGWPSPWSPILDGGQTTYPSAPPVRWTGS